jgi:hypothetical protein
MVDLQVGKLNNFDLRAGLLGSTPLNIEYGLRIAGGTRASLMSEYFPSASPQIDGFSEFAVAVVSIVTISGPPGESG